MMRLFKKVQARKTAAFAPELKNQGVKEPKKRIQKKGVPRFLTREIILKLKKKQSITDALSFASVAFTFYPLASLPLPLGKGGRGKGRNDGKARGKQRAKEEIANRLNKHNKSVNSLKEHKPIGNYIINIKPIKALQKKTTLIDMFDTTFLKIKPFFSILQKFTGLLLKKNAYLIKEAYPFIYAGLKGASTIGGFKKVLYNKILVQDRRLKPIYNRRKHNISHYMVVQNQFARLDKAFVYLGKKKLASMIGLVLKTAYYAIPGALSWTKTKRHNSFNNTLSTRARAIPNLVSIIEGQVTLLLWRNQFNNSLTKSRQDHRQGVSQNLGVVCKKNTAILLKE